MPTRRFAKASTGGTALPGLALADQDAGGEAGETAAGNAHAQEAAEESALKAGIVLERVDDGADFVFRFRGGQSADAIEVGREKFRPQATDEKCHRLHFRMHGAPENAFFEIFGRGIKPVAKSGFEVLRGVHGFRAWGGGAVARDGFDGVRIAWVSAIRRTDPGGDRCCRIATVFFGSRYHADYHPERRRKWLTLF
jgi:hypothetical protein